MAAIPRDRRLQWLQILRAVAASAILFHHCIYYAVSRAGLGDEAWANSAFAAGVDLFFVISGFVMMMVSDPDYGRELSPGKFMAKRITRIVPIYWFYTAIIIALGLTVPSIFKSTSVTPWSVFGSLTFIPYDQGPLLRVGWTLNYEMWFYTAFALVLAFRPGLWGRVAAMAAVFVAVYFAGKAAGREGPISIFLGYTITFEFVMGMAIYAMVRSRGKLRLPSALLLTVAGAALFCWAIARGDPGYDDRFIFWGIPAAALVYASLSFPEMKGSAGRLLELLGDASYSIYLSHMLTIGALYTLSRRLLPLQPPAFIALAFIASLAVGVASYLMIEKPLLQAARGGIRQARQRPT